MLCNKARNTSRHSRRWLRNPGWAQLVLLLCVTLTRGHLGHSARAGLGWWVPDRVTHMPGTVTGMAGWLGSAGIVRWGSHLWPLRRSWTPHVAAQGPQSQCPGGRSRRCLWAGPEASSVAPVPCSLSLNCGKTLRTQWGFPGGSRAEEPACQCRRQKKLRFYP